MKALLYTSVSEYEVRHFRACKHMKNTVLNVGGSSEECFVSKKKKKIVLMENWHHYSSFGPSHLSCDLFRGALEYLQ